MRVLAAFVLVALPVASTASAQDAPAPAFERDILVTGPGLVAVRLDRHVYEAARSDLGDLRVRDGSTETVPYTIDRGVSSARPGRRPRREEQLAPRWSRADVERPRETWLTLDLGARHHPFHAIVLDVEDEHFSRDVRVEVREDLVLSASDTVAPPERWRDVGGGVIYRVENEGESRECLRVEVAGRARAVRLRLRNRDDRPLRVVGVSVVVPVERLLFEAGDGNYTLTYGAPKLTAPTYDLARTLDDEPSTSAATLGPPVRRDVVADVLPWTERHPVLLWAGLLMVVAALGAVTWRALRSA